MNEKDRPGRRLFIKKTGLIGIAAFNLPVWFPDKFTMMDFTDKKPKRGLSVLFQGDSITDGNRSRNNDWNHLMGHGYAYLISSRLWYEHPDSALQFYNRGISGNKITDLAERWQEDTLDLMPGVLSILIGVNDVMYYLYGDENYSAKNFEKEYDALILQTMKTLPDTCLVLCEPFILPVNNVKENWDLWYAEIQKRQEIVSNLAARYKAVFVRLQKPFNEACNQAPADYWIWDGVHPMPAGHELIAREWIKTVSRTISFTC
jgi:lysophospholipase L1-like esterase